MRYDGNGLRGRRAVSRWRDVHLLVLVRSHVRRLRVAGRLAVTRRLLCVARWLRISRRLGVSGLLLIHRLCVT